MSFWFGVVAGAISLKRAGHGWSPVALLVLAHFDINIFNPTRSPAVR